VEQTEIAYFFINDTLLCRLTANATGQAGIFIVGCTNGATFTETSTAPKRIL
jgi:hypothetical protein